VTCMRIVTPHALDRSTDYESRLWQLTSNRSDRCRGNFSRMKTSARRPFRALRLRSTRIVLDRRIQPRVTAPYRIATRIRAGPIFSIASDGLSIRQCDRLCQIARRPKTRLSRTVDALRGLRKPNLGGTGSLGRRQRTSWLYSSARQ